LVSIQVGKKDPAASTLAFQLAQHVVGFAPKFVKKEDVTEAQLQDHKVNFEKEIERLKIVDSKPKWHPNKAYNELVLMDQELSLVGEISVKDQIEKVSAQVGSPIHVNSFVRFLLGEGIEKKSEDFAAEVGKLAGAP
jgi:elongation factor Ts